MSSEKQWVLKTKGQGIAEGKEFIIVFDPEALNVNELVRENYASCKKVINCKNEA